MLEKLVLGGQGGVLGGEFAQTVLQFAQGAGQRLHLGGFLLELRELPVALVQQRSQFLVLLGEFDDTALLFVQPSVYLP